MDIETDIVIVGAGSAGCALAGRLARGTALRVLLVEAGGRARSPWLHIPAGYYRTAYDERYSWRLQTEPQQALGGRRLEWPRGRVLGGSSAINGLVYVRGQPEDYDGWAAAGCTGWGWSDVLPVFRRSERNWRGAGPCHGGDGPLGVSPIPMRHRLLDRFIAAAEARGIPRNDDFNGPVQEGAGYFDLTTAGGLRCSAARAYLGRPLPRNLRIMTGWTAESVEIAEGRARGLRLHRAGGGAARVRAAAAVVLCAGAIGSPALLWQSGIGPGHDLAAAGLDVRHDLPEVGRNLQDHFQVKIAARVDGTDSYNLIWHSPLRRLGAALEFALHRRGPLAASGGQVGLFARVGPGATRPDVQFHVSPQSTADPARGLDRFAGFTVGVCVLRPESRGTLRPARLPGPGAPRLQTLIDPACLSDPGDTALTVAGLRLALDILRTPPFAAHLRGLAGGLGPEASDEALAAHCAATGNTVYHPAGTCRMGGDAASVVDPGLRLRGVAGLYVADASVMPTLISGNTNAPCIMIGERAADLLRADLGAGT